MMKRKGFTLIELMIVIAIIGILAAIAVPNFKKAREQAREKSCYANQRVILGAVEMYNMDNSAMISTGLTGKLTTLKDQGYLKSEPQCPSTTGVYSETEDMSGGGKVSCTIHQTVD
jgi:prepilin-type N-terminal cleavage/methylation domain-containing protein